MNGATHERFAQPTWTEGDVDNRLVLDEHRDDNISAGAEIRDRVGHPRTRFSKGSRLRSDHVEDGELMSSPLDAPCHPLTHPTQADEANLHVNVSPPNVGSPKITADH
jgi:hypothetical protein